MSGEKEMKTGKKAQLMTSSYASVHLLMSFQGEAGRAGAKAELGCERPRPSLPCCDPCLPTHKEPRLPATNECERESPSSRPPASLQSPACCKTVGVRHIPELLIIYIILISSLLDTLTCMGSHSLSFPLSASPRNKHIPPER